VGFRTSVFRMKEIYIYIYIYMSVKCIPASNDNPSKSGHLASRVAFYLGNRGELHLFTNFLQKLKIDKKCVATICCF
jgi:hypothetical protein